MLRILVLTCLMSTFGVGAHDICYRVLEDPVVRGYINALYSNKFSSEQLYLIEQPSSLFLKLHPEELPIYCTTGYVQPRMQFADNEHQGTCITYGTYFLIHEVYLEYVLEHPEEVKFTEITRTHEQMAEDIQKNIFIELPSYMSCYLADLCKDGAVFIDNTQGASGLSPSSLIKVHAQEGIYYIISPLFSELLLKRVQRDNLIPGACDDVVYISRAFNDRSHWTLMKSNDVAFFNEHKDDSQKGSFLSEKQAHALLESFAGLIPSLLQNKLLRVYVDTSGFMLGATRYTMAYFKEETGEHVFVVSPYFIHLIAKAHAKPYFVSLTPHVIENIQ